MEFHILKNEPLTARLRIKQLLLVNFWILGYFRMKLATLLWLLVPYVTKLSFRMNFL